MAADIAHTIEGVNVIIDLMPSTTLGVGSVFASKPIAIKPSVITPLLIRTPILMGKLCKPMVKALIFLAVFHSPYTTVSENSTVLMELATIPSMEPIQKMAVKLQAVLPKYFADTNAMAASTRNIQ